MKNLFLSIILALNLLACENDNTPNDRDIGAQNWALAHNGRVINNQNVVEAGSYYYVYTVVTNNNNTYRLWFTDISANQQPIRVVRDPE